MKLILKFIAICSSMIIANTFAFNLNITFDPSFITPDNQLDFTYTVFRCHNQPVCGIDNPQTADRIQDMLVTMTNIDAAMQLLRNTFNYFGTPAQSMLYHANSVIILDIIHNGQHLKLPNCTSIISGKTGTTLRVTPKGCIAFNN